MPDPARSWTMSINNLLSSGLTHTVQFRSLFFELKQACVASGATILISNGGGTAGAGDNIPNEAAVTTGTAGTGAWFVPSWPNIGGAALTALINVNDASAPFQAIQVRIGPATWTGGTTAALPTVGSGFATTTRSITQFHPFTDVRNVRWSVLRTTNVGGAQTIMFLLKEGGTSQWDRGMILTANSDADGGGIGFQRWGLFFPTNAAPFAASVTFATATNWDGLVSGGSASVTTAIDSPIWALSNSWTNGLDMQARCNADTIRIGQNQSSNPGRVMGTLRDIYAISQNSTFGLWTDSTEGAQTFRRKNMGCISAYWPTGIDVL